MIDFDLGWSVVGSRMSRDEVRGGRGGEKPGEKSVAIGFGLDVLLVFNFNRNEIMWVFLYTIVVLVVSMAV